MTMIPRLNKVFPAIELMIVAHKDQKYGLLPYSVHPIRVLEIVDLHLNHFANKNIDDFTKDNIRCAAVLHDVVEDTSITLDQIRNQFGEEVASIVHAVTNEPGKNRKERHEKTYPKIKANAYARIVKLADRIVNVEASVLSLKDDAARHGMRGTKFNMYAKEHKSFKEAIYIENAPEYMLWTMLENRMGAINV